MQYQYKTIVHACHELIDTSTNKTDIQVASTLRYVYGREEHGRREALVDRQWLCCIEAIEKIVQRFHPEFDAIVAPVCCVIATDATEARCQRADQLTIKHQLIACILKHFTCDIALHLPCPHARYRKRAVRVESSLVVSTRKASEGMSCPARYQDRAKEIARAACMP